MNSDHLPFPQPIHASRQIETLLHLRNAATLVARECFLESPSNLLTWKATGLFDLVSLFVQIIQPHQKKLVERALE